MIKVLHCVSKMDRGGIETLLMNIYRNINRNKIQMDFMVTTEKKGAYDNEISFLGGKIYSVSPRKNGILKNKKDIDSFFQKNRYDVVHLHVSSLSYIEPIISAFRYNIPVRIVHTHSTQNTKNIIHRSLHEINKKRIRKYSTHLLACSREAADWTFSNKNIDDVIIFKNAIDSDKFKYNIDIRKKIRNNMDLNNKLVVGHVGRFVNVKNHSFLIDVFNELKNIHQDCILLLIGEGELIEESFLKVKKLNLENSVIFLKSRSDINELMQAMDILLLPSFYEGLGIVLIEAQTSGLPVLVSENIPEEANITNRFHKEYLSVGAKSWAKKIIKITKSNRRESLSNQVKQSGYDIDEAVAIIEKLYNDLQI